MLSFRPRYLIYKRMSIPRQNPVAIAINEKKMKKSRDAVTE